MYTEDESQRQRDWGREQDKEGDSVEEGIRGEGLGNGRER